MMMTKLCEEREEHADHGGKRVPHLRLALFPLGCAATLRIAIRARVVVVALRRMVLLHRVHGNIPRKLLIGGWRSG